MISFLLVLLLFISCTSKTGIVVVSSFTLPFGVHPFSLSRTTTTTTRRRRRSVQATSPRGSSSRSEDHDDKNSNDNIENNNDNNNSNNHDQPSNTSWSDWRDFRARLVLRERGSDSQQRDVNNDDDDNNNNNNSTQPHWAYDAGQVIEAGSIILSSIDQDFGYGISQQYFHKSVILVLEHDEHMFTKGIVLNRPTNVILQDDDLIYEKQSPAASTSLRMNNKNIKNQFRLWYGGEVRWLLDSSRICNDNDDDDYSDTPEFTCLHALQNEAALRVSETVLNSSHSVVQWTTFPAALQLIEQGHATSDDFWLFAGYVGWSAGQLQDELERHSWYMVAADVETLWDELLNLQQQASNSLHLCRFDHNGNNNDDSITTTTTIAPGVDTWERLMKRIGRGDEACSRDENDFDDLMLREWTRKNLILDDLESTSEKDSVATESLPVLGSFPAGTLLRGSSLEHSPFLLSEQVFHKSILLVIKDDKDCTVGVILNRPLPDKMELDGRVTSIPLRYGGRFGVQGQNEKPTVLFHFSSKLRSADIGSPLGLHDGIWLCTLEEVCAALYSGLASEKEILCVRGLTVWSKAPGR